LKQFREKQREKRNPNWPDGYQFCPWYQRYLEPGLDINASKGRKYSNRTCPLPNDPEKVSKFRTMLQGLHVAANHGAPVYHGSNDGTNECREGAQAVLQEIQKMQCRYPAPQTKRGALFGTYVRENAPSTVASNGTLSTLNVPFSIQTQASVFPSSNLPWWRNEDGTPRWTAMNCDHLPPGLASEENTKNCQKFQQTQSVARSAMRPGDRRLVPSAPQWASTVAPNPPQTIVPTQSPTRGPPPRTIVAAGTKLNEERLRLKEQGLPYTHMRN